MKQNMRKEEMTVRSPHFSLIVRPAPLGAFGIAINESHTALRFYPDLTQK